MKNKQKKIGGCCRKEGKGGGEGERGGNLLVEVWPLWWMQGRGRGTMDQVSKFLHVPVLIRGGDSLYILFNGFFWCLKFF